MRLVPHSRSAWEKYLECLPERFRGLAVPKQGIFVADDDGVVAGVCVTEAGPYVVFYMLAVHPELDEEDALVALRIIAKNGRAMLMQSGLLGMWMSPPGEAAVPLMESGAGKDPVPVFWMDPNAPTMKPKANGAEPTKEEKPPSLETVAARLPPKTRGKKKAPLKRISLAHG